MKRIFATLAAAVVLSSRATPQAGPGDLLQAIRQNDLAALASQLDKGADVNARDSRGNTLLLYAAGYGTPEAVKLLLARGADVHAKNQFDATALIWGAADPRKARLLVEHGAAVNAASQAGRTPLMIAATCDGCAETVRLLLAKGAAVNARDKRGASALDSAVEANDLDTIRLLIDHGADPVSPDLAGYTPLMLSSANCNRSAVRLLLAKGANVNATNTFSGEVQFGKIQLIHLTPLMLAAPLCSAEVLKTLLDAGANVNEKDSRDMTSLMFAVASETQDLAVVKLLLNSGADLNVKSNMGETALDWARKFGDPKVIAALTAAGARPGDPFTPPLHKPVAPQPGPNQAARSALALLQSSTTEFFKQSGCVGCHHQPISTMAYSAARSLGVQTDEAAGQVHLNMIRQREARQQEPMLERISTGGQTDTPAYAMLALGIAKAPPTDDAAANAIYIAGAQHRDGSWRLNGTSRAPMQESVIGRTVIALRALQLYAPPAQKADMEERIARARNFLLTAKPATNDDYAMQMLGLRWTGAAPARIQAVGQELIARQRPDGGWAQNRNLSSDAYATGQSLWALNEAGLLPPASPAYQRGVQFLLKTQWADGSWYVRSRAVKLQPYFQSGFPYDHDQWISAAATGYAVMALAASGSGVTTASSLPGPARK